MSKFSIGQNAIDVCKTIIAHYSEIHSVRLIAHKVDINWRQRHLTASQKIKHMPDSFEHSKPIRNSVLTKDGFAQLTLGKLNNLGENHVWSFTSKVQCMNGKTKHLPMMNFHPEKCSLPIVSKAIKYICKNEKGVLLDSGRFYHYYGCFLLNEDEWVKFMGEFLMPIVLVSPRYVGHRLHDGYCSLRLTADYKYKPKVPEVIKIL